MFTRKLLLLVIVLLTFSKATFAQHIPDTVRVGTYIISVHNIDFHAKEYTVKFWLWFVYDKNVGKRLKLDLPNQIDIPYAKESDEPKVLSDTVGNKVWIQMRMKVVMKQNWIVHDFPFDEQYLNVVVENTVFDNKNLVFIADQKDSRFDGEDAVDGWLVDGFKVSEGTNTYNTGFGEPNLDERVNNFSTFKFEMSIKRHAIGLFMKIFIGMYIAFLISLVSFLSDPGELEPRFGLPVGGLFAAVGNKYIIDSLLPESSQFSLVDILHSLTFFGIFAILTVSAIALKLHNSGKIPAAHRANKIGAIFVLGLYIILNIYYVFNA